MDNKSLLGINPIRYLFTGWVAVGVEVTGVWHSLLEGTGESCIVMLIEKYKLISTVLSLLLNLLRYIILCKNICYSVT